MEVIRSIFDAESTYYTKMKTKSVIFILIGLYLVLATLAFAVEIDELLFILAIPWSIIIALILVF